jgi:2,5-dichloro-2,5-cyclohexadiene-1,4-diol dehydrogenase 1
MPGVKDKSIIVTGGASGIGAATARLAAQRGGLVTIADLSPEAGQSLVEQIRQNGGEAQYVQVDIADDEQVQTLVNAATTTYGALHGAFNNAGLPPFSQRPGNPTTLFAELTTEELRKTVDVNLIGTFQCIKHEVTAMLQTGGGSIVNTSSGAGILAIPAAADYISTKHAIIGLTKAAALDYATQGIRVNAILPGMIRTPMVTTAFDEHPEVEQWATEMQPNKRLGEPEEIAEAALWLLSDAASLVTGLSMNVDGGLTMV